jgi:hypothetical protein
MIRYVCLPAERATIRAEWFGPLNDEDEAPISPS